MPFCQRENETIKHLFWDCNVIQPFIHEFTTWVVDKCNSIEHLDLNCSSFMFGTTKYGLMFNKILMKTKQYIYKCKMRERIPYLNALKFEIRHLFEIEKSIALKQSKLEKLNSLWEPLMYLCVP